MNIISVKSIFPFCKLKIGSLIPAIQIYMSKIGLRRKNVAFSRVEETFDGLGWTGVHSYLVLAVCDSPHFNYW